MALMAPVRTLKINKHDTALLGSASWCGTSPTMSHPIDPASSRIWVEQIINFYVLLPGLAHLHSSYQVYPSLPPGKICQVAGPLPFLGSVGSQLCCPRPSFIGELVVFLIPSLPQSPTLPVQASELVPGLEAQRFFIKNSAHWTIVDPTTLVGGWATPLKNMKVSWND